MSIDSSGISAAIGDPHVLGRVLDFLSSLLTSASRSMLALQLEIAALRHQLSAGAPTDATGARVEIEANFVDIAERDA